MTKKDLKKLNNLELIEYAKEQASILNEDFPTINEIDELVEIVDEKREKLLQEYADKGLKLYSQHDSKFEETEKYLKLAAERNHIKGMFYLGQLYLNSNNPKYLKDGEKWLSKAADTNDMKSMLNYASRLEKGTKVKKDIKKALKHYLKCAEKGNTDAQKKLSYLYFSNNKLIRNEEKGIKWHTVLADNNDLASQTFLGNYFYNKADFRKAFKYMTLAVENGSSSFTRELGDMYFNGKGTTKNISKSFSYYEKLADNGDKDLIKLLAENYESGEIIKKNIDKAVKYYSKFWTNLDNKKLKEIGDYYKNGQVKSRDSLKNALLWYERAADKGNKECLSFLIKNSKKSKKTIEWMKISAENGNTKYQKQLGKYYLDSKYYKESIKWYEMSANNGDLDSQLKLGEIYNLKHNYSKDSFKWYLEAAKQGDAKAQYITAINYQKGIVTNVNKSECLKWLEKSSIQGNLDATNLLSILTYENAVKNNDNFDKAFHLLNKASIDNDEKYNDEQLKVILYLGECWFYGRGTNVDYNKAYFYFDLWETATSKNIDINVLEKIGKNLYHGNNCKKNIKLGLVLLEKVANKSLDIDLLRYLGDIYKSKNSKKKTFEFYLKAAEKGDKTLYEYIGNCYYKGTGIKKDITKALFWYEKSANETKDIEQYKKIGDIYFDLNYYTQGIEYFRYASEKGDNYSCEKLGIYFFENRESDEDEKNAFKYLSLCLNSDNDKIMYYLGLCYYEGIGTEDNKSLSLKCFKQSLKQGNNQVLNILSIIAYEDAVENNGVFDEAFQLLNKALSDDDKKYNDEQLRIILYLGECWFYGRGTSVDYNKAHFYFDLWETSTGKNIDFKILEKIGRCLYHGNNCKKNKKLGLELLEKVANKSLDIDLLKYIGDIYKSNNSKKKTFEFYLKAVEAGDESLYEYVGNCYYKGTGIKKDIPKALFWYEKSVAKNTKDIELYKKIGDIYFDLNYHAQGIEYYKFAAKKGDNYSCEKLGIYYFENKESGENKNRAFKYLSLCLNSDNGKPLYYLGLCYYVGIGTLPDNYKAFEFIKKAAEFGYVDSFYKLGKMYSNGIGTDKNYELALEYFLRAYRYGKNIVQEDLFWIYYKGIGTNKDLVKAEQFLNYMFNLMKDKKIYSHEEYFNELNQDNDTDIFFDYGKKYFVGDELEKNIDKSLKYLKMSAELNNSDAYIYLANIYYNDMNCIDTYKAYSWYKKSAEAGNPEALYMMGQFYELGTNVLPDKHKALEYYKKAKEAGHEKTEEKISFLQELINKEKKQLKLEEERNAKLIKEMQEKEAKEKKEREKRESKERKREQKQREREQKQREREYIKEKKIEKKQHEEYLKSEAKKGTYYDKERLAEFYSNNNKKNLAIKWYKKAAKDGSYSAERKLNSLGVKFKKSNRYNRSSFIKEISPYTFLFIVVFLIVPALFVILSSRSFGTLDFSKYIILGIVFIVVFLLAIKTFIDYEADTFFYIFYLTFLGLGIILPLYIFIIVISYSNISLLNLLFYLLLIPGICLIIGFINIADHLYHYFAFGMIISAIIFILSASSILPLIKYKDSKVIVEKEKEYENYSEDFNENIFDRSIYSIHKYEITSENPTIDINLYEDFYHYFDSYMYLSGKTKLDSQNVRNKPDMDSTILTKIKSTDTFYVLGHQGEWYDIYLITDDYEGFGWIYGDKEYLDINHASFSTPELIELEKGFNRVFGNKLPERLYDNKDFRIGDLESKLKTLMGTPDVIATNDERNYWYYGNSYIVFKNSKVIGYDNIDGNLKVFMGCKAFPDNYVEEYGSTKYDVSLIYGTPLKVYIEDNGKGYWYYENKTFAFNSDNILISITNNSLSNIDTENLKPKDDNKNNNKVDNKNNTDSSKSGIFSFIGGIDRSIGDFFSYFGRTLVNLVSFIGRLLDGLLDLIIRLFSFSF